MTKVKSNIDVQSSDFEQIDIDYKTDLTVPNQSLSVNDILTNFTRGVGMQSVARSIYYDGFDDFDSDDDTLRPDFDLSDVSNASEEIINALKAESERKAREKLRRRKPTTKSKTSQKRKIPLKKAFLSLKAKNRLKLSTTNS